MLKPFFPVALSAALLVPGAAIAAGAADPPSPRAAALRAELAGHLTVGSQMRAARHDVLHERLGRVNLRLARKLARLGGVRVGRAERERIDGLPVSSLQRRERRLRTRIEHLERRVARRRAAADAIAPGTAAPAAQGAGTATPGHLAAIAACESGGNPSAVGGGGQFRGKYQFTMSTWQSVGGSGDPAAASEAEQDARAAALYAQQGSSPWPVCGG